MNLKIFKQEIADGLQEIMETGNRIVCSCEIVECEKFDIVKDSLPTEFMTAYGSEENPDLFYYKSILASTGINKNGHYFLPEYLWKAKGTAVNKRVNYEHIENDIIGTDLEVYASDHAGNLIGDDTSLHDLPDNYDVVTKGVIYRIWSDPKRQKAMDSIINNMKEGKLGVSMEAIFSDYDYVLINKAGEEEFIPRTSKTAHLSKYLKKFGGKGIYNEKVIGMVLKDFIFAGKGVVKVPANKRSIVTEVEDSERNINVVDKISASDVYSNTEGNNMTLEEATLKINELQGKISELAVANTTLNKTIEDEKAQLVKASEDFKIQIQEKVKEVETVTAKVVELTKVIASHEEEKETVRRVELVVAQLELTKDEALAYVADYKELAAEKFDKVIASQNAVLVAKQIPQKTDKPAPKGGYPKEVSVKDIMKKATASLEDAKVDEVPNPSVQSEQKDSKNLAREQISAYLIKPKK